MQVGLEATCSAVEAEAARPDVWQLVGKAEKIRPLTQPGIDREGQRGHGRKREREGECGVLDDAISERFPKISTNASPKLSL